MNPRIVAAMWGAVVTAALVLVPMGLRDRLPDPLATHWTGSGPDGMASFTTHVLTVAAVWTVVWVAMLAATARGWSLRRRNGRMLWWGALFGGGTLVLGTQASTVSANLDVPHWSAASLPGGHVVLVVLASAGVGVLAGYLGRGGPDPVEGVQAPPAMRLRPGRRTVWVSHLVNPWLVALAVTAAAVIVVLCGLRLAGVVEAGTLASVLPGAVIVLVAGVATSTLSVRAGDDTVVIGFGPLGVLARRIPLSRIDRAWTEDRRPSEVGGWGFRGLPGAATIMLRGGECLVLAYRSGGRLTISIDDAERGASLINALVAERARS
ncbi:hypothetical protein ACFFV7_51570 [Nonomuraea spiralis]|uniref:DUF1648 domain-containing protein n=1 Tax=Nonomuraea spiralis TaxID=46182 RepID=A0ABV5IYQ5_9ACTN|nr:DUF1648 domain-containing protein [Nonomuraea spiralis]GGS87610.1 hypothetical protein GCM10010176_034120 [Nonomuraea spiralis]